MRMHNVRITVLKRLQTDEIMDKYGGGPEARGLGPRLQTQCPIFREGQQFLVKDLTIVPEGFCAWAWADIQRDIAALALGADFFWIKKKDATVACCTDGLRPVIFELERVDE